MKSIALGFGLVSGLASGLLGCMTTADADPCEAAQMHIDECLGDSAPPPLASCDTATADRILGQSCDALVTNSGKADGIFDRALCALGFLCWCEPDASATDDEIIDDGSDDTYACGGPCRVETAGGYGDTAYHYAAPNHGASGTFRIPVNEEGVFRIDAFIPSRDGAGAATYSVNTCSGFTDFEIDQSLSEAGWVEIATTHLEPGAELRVRGASGDAFLMDAIEVTRQ